MRSGSSDPRASGKPAPVPATSGPTSCSYAAAMPQPQQGEEHLRTQHTPAHVGHDPSLEESSVCSPSHAHVHAAADAASSSASSCPATPAARDAFSAQTGMPTNLEAASTSSPGTAAALSPMRQASTIPMAPIEQLPKHQMEGGPGVWMYPSEQMFFNAMKRKVREGDRPHLPPLLLPPPLLCGTH